MVLPKYIIDAILELIFIINVFRKIIHYNIPNIQYKIGKNKSFYFRLLSFSSTSTNK